MWDWFYRLASPRDFYLRSGQFIQFFGWFSICFLSIGIVWGLIFSPPDYQQGETVRIMYLHVPCAILSQACFLAMAVFGAILLIWQIKMAGMMLRATALVGTGLTVLTLLTGSLWGRPMWGTWWVWDARLTSELILCLIYVAILAIQNSFRSPASADKGMAILALIGVIDLPIIHYSVYWWNTLHQGSSFPLGAKPLIDVSMLWPLFFMMIGLVFFSACIVLQLARTEVLKRSVHMDWVTQWFDSNQKERA